MGYGFRMELGGIPELVKKFKAFPKQQTGAFKKAAKACAKIMLSATRANIKQRVGKPKHVDYLITDAAREQIKNGTISMKTLKSKADMQNEQIQLLKQREKEGKSGKVKVEKYKTEQVKISTLVEKTKGVLEYGKTGSLAKSIVSKVGSRKPKKQFVKGKNGKGKFKSVASRQVYAMVGPKHLPGVAYNPWIGRMAKVDPYNYAHLVELGHRLKIRGKDTGRMVKPYPFLRPAFNSVKSRLEATAKSILTKELANIWYMSMSTSKPRPAARRRAA
jgi:hypothetical protein